MTIHALLSSFPLVVPIQGGLGGQIFGYALYKYLQCKSPYKVLADASSLVNSNGYKLAFGSQKLNQYVWDLSYYGINPCSDANIISSRRKSIFFSKIFRRYLYEGTTKRSRFYNALKSQLNPSTFPISESHQLMLQKDYSDRELMVVHIRQSDYLNVSSLVLPVEYSFDIVKKFIHIGMRKIIYVSDGFLDSKYISHALNHQIQVLQSSDYFLIHAIMRRANVLITSNSQFSISAGFLSENQLTIFPKLFFGSKLKTLNKVYQDQFNFFLK